MYFVRDISSMQDATFGKEGKGIYYELASNKVLGYPTEIFDFVLGEVLIAYRNETK